MSSAISFPYPILNSSYGGCVVVEQDSEDTDETLEATNQQLGSIQLVISEPELTDVVPSQHREELAQLLSQITNENMHAEVQWGRPVGEEEW